MYFRNAMAYRMTAPMVLEPEVLEEKLSEQSFTPCAATQPRSIGWAPPMGDTSELLAHHQGGRILLRLRIEDRILPPAVIRKLLKDKVDAIEAQQERKVYRKERLTLQDELILDNLPKAFTQTKDLLAFIDTRAGWLFVDTASPVQAEELLSCLRGCIGSLPVVLPQVVFSPAQTMTGWVARREPPADFAFGHDCELREPGDTGCVIRCRGIDLLGEEVESHLVAGRQIVRVNLILDGQASFTLSESLTIRRIRFADQLLKESDDVDAEDEAAKLDADFALMSDTIVSLYSRIIDLFGGEDL